MHDGSGFGGDPDGGWRLEGTDGSGRPVRLLIADADIADSYLGIAVGRHPALCQRVIDDSGVSRRHFRIGRSAAGVIVEDLHSLNGTTLDGAVLTPFQPALLSPGQTLTLGHVRLRVERLDGETRAA